MDPRYTLRWLIICCACFAACGCGGGSSSGASDTGATSTTLNTAATALPNNEAAPEPELVTEVEEQVTIALMVLYTPGVAVRFADPDLRIQHLVNVANDVLSGSGARLELELVHVERVTYPDEVTIVQALEDVTFGHHPSVANVTRWRDSVAADLVVLLRPYANDGHCGHAWIGGYGTQGDFSNAVEADYAYSVVAADCSDYVLLHEVGHNLGLAHSRREDPAGGTYPYAAGFGMDNDFVTIMASPTEFNAVRLPFLSTPHRQCNGVPCGISQTDAARGADAVTTLNVVAPQVQAYR